MGGADTPSPETRSIKVLGLDPGFANWGAALGTLTFNAEDPTSSLITISEVDVLSTERSKVKSVRRNSDDFARATGLSSFLLNLLSKHAPLMVFSEIPSGAQSANAAKGFGIALGLLAALAPNLVQVMPLESKEALTGSKSASKQDMIGTAFKKHGKAKGWKKRNNKLIAVSEHQADAIASIYAGIRTPEFAQLWSVLKP